MTWAGVDEYNSVSNGEVVLREGRWLESKKDIARGDAGGFTGTKVRWWRLVVIKVRKGWTSMVAVETKGIIQELTGLGDCGYKGA